MFNVPLDTFLVVVSERIFLPINYSAIS